MRAVDEFLNQLSARSGLDAANILFVIDYIRPESYSEESIETSKSSFVAQLNRYLEDHAKDLGYEVIDMQPAYIMKNRLDNSRFEFETDSHWNELGN